MPSSESEVVFSGGDVVRTRVVRVRIFRSQVAAVRVVGSRGRLLRLCHRWFVIRLKREFWLNAYTCFYI